jgi:serine/threonine protein kinase/WD40 repeat protein
MERFGKFEIIEEIARGGMGVVYKGIDPQRPGVVAIKVLIAGDEAPPKSIERFYQEAEAISRLQHPNIVKVLEIGEADGRHYYSMNYVEGITLDAVITKGGLKESDTAHIIKEIASALAYCHGMNIIHRDIKPSNIIVDKKTWLPKILDFGIAKDLVYMTQLTAEQEVLGTPQYMSPEQAAGDHSELDHRSDIYSLGAVMYEMLTGRPPIIADNYSEMIVKVVQGEKELPSYYNPQVHKQLEAICMKAMSRNKEERYSSAQDFVNDLANFQSPKKCLAKPVTVLNKALINAKKYSAFVLFGTLTFSILAIITLSAALRWNQFENNRRDKLEFLEQRIEDTLKNSEKEGQGNLKVFADYMNRVERYLEVMQVIKPYDANLAYYRGKFEQILEKRLADLESRGQREVQQKQIPDAYITATWMEVLGGNNKYKNFSEIRKVLHLQESVLQLDIQSNTSSFLLYRLEGNAFKDNTNSSFPTGVPLENLESGSYLLVLDKETFVPTLQKIQFEKSSLTLQAPLVSRLELPPQSYLFYKKNEEGTQILPFLGMDESCVSINDYYYYLRLKGKDIPKEFTFEFLQEQGHLPIQGLSEESAKEFAKWQGKRLPTEEEWEWLNRNNNQNYYPPQLSSFQGFPFIQNILVHNEPELLDKGKTVLSLPFQPELSIKGATKNSKVRFVWDYSQLQQVKTRNRVLKEEIQEFKQFVSELDYAFQQFLKEYHQAYLSKSYMNTLGLLKDLEKNLKEPRYQKYPWLPEKRLKSLSLLNQMIPSLMEEIQKLQKENEKIRIESNRFDIAGVQKQKATFEIKLQRNKTENVSLERLTYENLIELCRRKSHLETSLAVLSIFQKTSQKEAEGLIRNQSPEIQESFDTLFPQFNGVHWPSFYEAQDEGYIFFHDNKWILPKEAKAKLGFYFFENKWVQGQDLHREGKAFIDPQGHIYSPVQAQSLGYIFKKQDWFLEEKYWKKSLKLQVFEIPGSPTDYFTASTLLDENTLVLGTLKGQIFLVDLNSNEVHIQRELNLKRLSLIRAYAHEGIMVSGIEGHLEWLNLKLETLQKFTDVYQNRRLDIVDHLYFSDSNRVVLLNNEGEIHFIKDFKEATKPLLESFTEAPKTGQALKLEPDGKKMLAVYARNDSLTLYTGLTEFIKKSECPLEQASRQRIKFTQDFLRIASVSSGAASHVTVFQAENAKNPIQIEVGDAIRDFTWNFSGNLLAVATLGGKIKIFDLRYAKNERLSSDMFNALVNEFEISPNHQVNIESVFFSPKGDALFTLGKLDSERKVLRWEN